MSHTATSSRVTIIDVARAAGVSYATVSRVLNDDPYVKLETRERVSAALDRMGYVANRQARSLRTGRSQMIGLLVRDLGTGYVGEIVAGIDAEIAGTDREMLLFTTHQQAREPEYVATIVGGMADGLLLVLPFDVEPYGELLAQRRFPYVLIDYEGSAVGPAVSCTNRQGVYEGTSYLFSLGHRRIGFITGNMAMGSARSRLLGYRQALSDHGLAEDPALVVEGDYQQPAGHAGALALLALPNPPSAIFASNDVMAFGAMDAIRNVGLRIPQDVSVLGFDDVPQAAGVSPALTTVHQPLHEMGRQAVQMLLACIDDPGRPFEYRELATKLVPRNSCQPIAPAG